MNSCFCGVVTFLCFIVLSSQQDTPTTPKVTDTVTTGGTTDQAANEVSKNEPQSEVPKARNKDRVPVVSGTLNSNDKVVHSSHGVKSAKYSRMAEIEVKPPKKKKRIQHSYHRLIGKDRPRKYVFLPGRSLGKGKRCRPNEVQGMNGRCIRRRRHTKSRTNN